MKRNVILRLDGAADGVLTGRAAPTRPGSSPVRSDRWRVALCQQSIREGRMKKTPKFGILATALSTFILAPLVARADTITESFSIEGTCPLNPATLCYPTSNPFPQFNPAIGTLDDLSVTVTGNAVVQGEAEGVVYLDLANLSYAGETSQGFGSGQITLDLQFNVSADSSFVQMLFVGTGTAQESIGVIPEVVEPPDDTFTIEGSLSGTITYDFTPAPATGSDPITIALMGVTFGLFALSRRARKAASDPTVPSIIGRLRRGLSAISRT